MIPDVEVKTDVSAKFSLNPKLSQISIILSFAISAISFFSSFVFVWNQKDSTVPFFTGSLFLVVACIGWLRAQRAIDMSGAIPTEVIGSNGLRISTDTRAIESDSTVKNLSKIIQVLAYRHPLPKPDGLIDSNGNIIPNSECESHDLVDAINSENSQAAQNFEKLLFEKQTRISELPIDSAIEKHNGLASD